MNTYINVEILSYKTGSKKKNLKPIANECLIHILYCSSLTGAPLTAVMSQLRDFTRACFSYLSQVSPYILFFFCRFLFENILSAACV